MIRWQRRQRLAFGFHMALAPENSTPFAGLARRVSPTLYRVQGAERPTPFVEDIAVPPEALPDFLVRLQNVLKKHEVTASFFAHAGHGQLHVRPFLEPGQSRPMSARCRPWPTSLYEEVFKFGGTISGEHGSGLSRTWFLRKQFGPLYDVFREVKRIFDPQNLLNPGKVVADMPTADHQKPADLSGRMGTRPSRTPSPSADRTPANGSTARRDRTTKPLDLQLELERSIVAHGQRLQRLRPMPDAVARRPDVPDLSLAPAEEASPRAKANLMRAVIEGQLDPGMLAKDELKEIADLCVNCHQCRLECPAGVDIPKLMIEAKAQYVASNGLATADWVLTRIDAVARWSSRLAPLANWVLHTALDAVAAGKDRRHRSRAKAAARGIVKLPPPRRATTSHAAHAPHGRQGRSISSISTPTGTTCSSPRRSSPSCEHNNIAVYVHPDQQPVGHESTSPWGMSKGPASCAAQQRSRCWPKRCGKGTKSCAPNRRRRCA